MCRDEPASRGALRDLAATHRAIALEYRHSGNAREAKAAFNHAVATYASAARLGPDDKTAFDDSVTRRLFALFLSETGEFDEAVGLYRAAVGTQERLAGVQSAVQLYRAELGRTLTGYARLQDQMGQTAPAAQTYSTARDLAVRLARENPAVGEYLNDLGDVCFHYGMHFQMTSEPFKATDLLRESVDARRKLIASLPSDDIDRKGLANSLLGLGVVLAITLKFDDATKATREAIGILEDLTRLNPSYLFYASDLASGYVGMGAYTYGRVALSPLATAEKKAAARTEAVAWYEKAIPMTERVLAANPKAAQDRFRLAQTYNTLGLMYDDVNDAENAVRCLGQSVQHFTRVIDGGSNNMLYRVQLAQVLNNYGRNLAQLGRDAEALAAHRQGIQYARPAFDKSPQLYDVRRTLGYHYFGVAKLERKAGRPAEAFAAAAERLKVRDDDPAEVYRAGCMMALCIPVVAKAAPPPEGRPAAEDRYARSAVAALRQALTQGYKELAKLRDNEELAPLRQRADFLELLWEVADNGPSKPP